MMLSITRLNYYPLFPNLALGESMVPCAARSDNDLNLWSQLLAAEHILPAGKGSLVALRWCVLDDRT